MNTKVNIKQTTEIVNSIIEKIEEEEKRLLGNDKDKKAYVDKNFEITHREVTARFCESGGDPVGIVKGYIIRNTKLTVGLYFGSISETSEKTGVSRRTVVKVFNLLQYDDLIRLYRDGVWAVHPNFLRRGNSGRYIGLLRFYNSLPKKVRPKKEEEFEEDDCEFGRKLRVIK